MAPVILKILQPTHPGMTQPKLIQPAFNTDAIVFDNSPWRPGREMDIDHSDEEDERKLKSLATRIMSNGVEVLVKDKNAEHGKPDQRRIKRYNLQPLKQTLNVSPNKNKKLLASAVATVFNQQHLSELYPMQQMMHKNYIIKTCLTTFTYMTTVVQNKRSAISTFETIVSVVTTESLTNLFATDLMADIKPTKTKFMEYKTIQPSAISNVFKSNLPKLDKRIDSSEEENHFELIQPSETEHDHTHCTTSCSCSHTKTESLKTKYNYEYDHHVPTKTTKYGVNKLEVRPTNKQPLDKKTQYPYEYETNTPTDKIVEKYTEVINDYSDEKNSGSVEESELLTNEQAPAPPKIKTSTPKPEKSKPEKLQKPNKNKFVVADLLKLGSLGIKGLSQLAPVFEKMTGSFIKRQEANKNFTSSSTTTVKPVTVLTPYNVNKRIDSELEFKHNTFPIYIPVDELEASESQNIYTNATLHQNLAWANDYNKHSKAHIIPPKMVHESPLVNGGIPISPGEIINANSDVIVGKPAVGGPLTLATSGIKLQNPVIPPPIDSFVSSNDQYVVKEKPSVKEKQVTHSDDSYDLRPPELPKPKNKHQNPPRNIQRPHMQPPNGHIPHIHHNHPNKNASRPPNRHYANIDVHLMKTEQISTTSVLGNHGRPAFLDYIPSLDKSSTTPKNHIPLTEVHEDLDVPDNSPSSSEIINTRVNTKGEYIPNTPIDSMNKPFLVDIQPSRVANVLIPHGSTTALVFAGSSEPHKTGDYVDDPLPYPEPGYFGSFSIDAPQLTNVHAAPTKSFHGKPNVPQHESYKPNPFKEQDYRNDIKQKWKGNKRQPDYNRLPPPTSNQETHLQVGPHITVYNPDIYKPNGNGEFEKYNQVRGKDKYKEKEIDKEYENFLAVPPPPMTKLHYHNENQYDKNKFASQKPIVHTRPIQDMKVFLNIQHPIPKPQMTMNQGQDKQPQKVTSEIYFAAQAPPHTNTPTYTIHMPQTPNPTKNLFNQGQSHTNTQTHFQASPPRPEQNSFYAVPSVNLNKPTFINEVNDKDNMYTVTLNTATNVASNVADPGQIIGSSVPVSIGNNMNADIPIGTNFAIKVEDGNSYSQNERAPQSVTENNRQTEIDATKENNRWNASSITYRPTVDVNTDYTKNHDHSFATTEPTKSTSELSYVSSLPSVNSHANFPMVKEQSSADNVREELKPVTEYVDERPDQKRPAKLIPNIPTNSHGWYSNVPINDLKNIQVEGTTRKVIPLLSDYNKDNLPDFGQKIQSIGKPPSEYWADNTPSVVNSIGKPFTKQKLENQYTLPNSQFNSNFIPHNFGVVKQPVYDIPIRDNSDETTTQQIVSSNEKKVVYEDSEEIYDGEEGDSEAEGEVSLESMKVPVVSTSDTKKHTSNSSNKQTKQDENKNTEEIQKNKNTQSLNDEVGSQTEKPFNAESYNKTHHFHSNAINTVYNNNPQTRPRPFNPNPATLDHQLHQPHWQINQLEVNTTNASYEENLDLNIGEEYSSTHSTSKPAPTSKSPNRYQEIDNKYKRIQRPVFSLRNNGTHNDTDIITSTVEIRDKKPLTVMENANENSSTLPTFTSTSSNYDSNNKSDIIDLSPPPPTLDYNFKPAAKEETIMGMSPPPRTPMAPPSRPTRPPPTPRPVPIRTPSPYRPKPTRQPPSRLPPRTTRKPIIRDEVSTYRPPYDILNNAKRPSYNRDHPSSQLLPPPRELPSRVVLPNNDEQTAQPAYPNVVFPTPISTGWMTSTSLGFPSNFDFGPSMIHFPEPTSPSIFPRLPEIPTTDKSHHEKETALSTKNLNNVSMESPVSENVEVSTKESSTEKTSNTSSSEENYKDYSSESSLEDTTTDKMKVLPIRNKNRTRKPYPVREDDKKTTTNKYKLPPSRPTSVIKPTRTLNRPDILYPTRQPNTRKVVRPLPSRHHTIVRPSLIESSETFVDNELIKPTQVIDDTEPTALSDKSSLVEKTPTLESTLLHVETEIVPKVQPTHHAGNEIKIVDEVVPTKTEFRTEVVTLTKTLTEEPKTVLSINYQNLTHTLTVTKTKTSLISQFEGATTQTLVLTNYQTSTIVDVVTEIHTQVQPTTLIETVTKHVPIQVEPTPVQEVIRTKSPLDDISLSSEENENLIIKDDDTTENIQKIDQDAENDKDTFFVVMNKSQNGGNAPPVSTDIETQDYDITRNEQVNSNGVSQVLFGEILLAGTPYLETTNVVNPSGTAYGKECQPDCKASRNERCQRIDGIMKCVCRPGFARMFPDRPCKPTYTYSVKLALNNQGKERLRFHESLSDNSSKQYNNLAMATHEGINRMIMQSDLRDVYHGVHITGFHPVEIKEGKEAYQGVMNDFYVQLSDNAHESRLKEVIEKYLRNNNYSLGGTDVFAAGELMDRLDVSDFDECTSGQFHDCSEHAQCFNLRGTYTCSCLEGFADLSVNSLYPGRICSAEPVGCEMCNYHGACYSRDDRRVLCECFQWHAGSTCQINLKVVLISLVTVGALLTVVLVICAVVACSKRPRPPQRSIVACIQGMPGLPQGAPSKQQRADRRALINERGDSGDASSLQNASLPYIPAKKQSSSGGKKIVISEPPAHDPPPVPAPAVMIPRARLHPTHRDSREMASRKQSMEVCSEAKLISYLESGVNASSDEMMRRKHSVESSYSAPKERHNKQGALVSAGFKVSTTIRRDEQCMKEDDLSSVDKHDLQAEMERYDELRKSYSQEDMSEWTDAERRIGELTLSEARSVGGTLPASTGRAASSTRLTLQEANTMAERDLGSTFLLPHVHLYKPDMTSDVSEFDSL